MGVEVVAASAGVDGYQDNDDWGGGMSSSWRGRDIGYRNHTRTLHPTFRRGVLSFNEENPFGVTSGRLTDVVTCNRSFVKTVARGVRNLGRKARHFEHKHRKEIIITAVALTAIVIVAVTIGTGTSAAAAGTAAAIEGLRRKKEEEENSKTPPPKTNGAGVGTPPRPPPPSSQAAQIGKPITAQLPDPFRLAQPPSLVTPNLVTPSASIPTLRNQQPPPNFSSPPPKLQHTSLAPSSYKPWTPAQASQLTRPVPTKASTPHEPLTIATPSERPIISIDPDAPIRVYNQPPQPPPTPKIFEVPGTQLARGKIGGINGIGNSFQDAQAHANYLSSLASGSQVQWIHNRSHSSAIDAFEALAVNFAGYSAPAKDIKETWVKFHEDHKNDPGAKYLQFCHSQGAIHVKNALLSCPKEIRDRIVVVAIAPATIIPKALCAGSFNYASKRDPIPLLEAAVHAHYDDGLNPELTEHRQTVLKELIRLDPHPDAPIFDHEFESPTFQERIAFHLKAHITEYGNPQ